MTCDVVTVDASMQIREAVQLLLDQGVSGAPVLNQQGQLIGMLTERDCIDAVINTSYFDEPGHSVMHYMASPVDTTDPETGLIVMAQKFRDSPYRRFPVVEGNIVIGIVSRQDIVRALQQSAWFGKPS